MSATEGVYRVGRHPTQQRPPEKQFRLERMREKRAQGESLARIAAFYGLSRQRVHQLLSGSKCRRGGH